MSLVLCLVLMFQMLPVQVLAESAPGDNNNEPVPAEEVIEEPQEVERKRPDVVDEVLENRERSGKHFRMSDGTYLAATFGTPVHYEDETGAWVEVDNRPEYKDGLYQIRNADTALDFAETLDSGEILTVSVGQSVLSMRILDTEEALARAETAASPEEEPSEHAETSELSEEPETEEITEP